MEPIRVGFLGFDQFMALDVIGPMEAFSLATAQTDDGKGKCGYEASMIGLSKRQFVAECGATFKARWTIADAPRMDTLVIPGGCGLREEGINRKVVEWVKSQVTNVRRMVSVCTGIYGLAPTGVLDGRRVTTHWRFTDDVAKRFPKLKVVPNELFVKDGPIYTSAGVTAGIDLSLFLIEEDYGPAVGLAVARELVVFLKRPGGQDQYSEPLRFQTQSSNPFSDLVAWMTGHLDQDLSVEALADRVRLCPRHFTRRFKQLFQRPPAEFVHELRMSESRKRLLALENSVDSISTSVGFRSADAFRRAFERRFGTNPTAFRRNFQFSTRRQQIGKRRSKSRSAPPSRASLGKASGSDS